MQIYILINAIMYLVFGVWSALKPHEIAGKVGFALNNEQGVAEFVAVYGGLEFALGVVCLVIWFNPELYRTGMIGLCILYACLALFRTYSIYAFGSTLNAGWYFYALEVMFLISSLILLRR